MSMEKVANQSVLVSFKNSEMTYFISHLNVFVVKGRKCTFLNLLPICALTLEEQYACVYVTDEHTRTSTSTYRHMCTQNKTTHVQKHTYIHTYEHTPYTHTHTCIIRMYRHTTRSGVRTQAKGKEWIS